MKLILILFFFLFSVFSFPGIALGVTVDGVIEQGEYSIEGTFNEGKLEIYFKVEGEKAYLGLSGETVGWLGIGFGNSVAMRNADMIIGLVQDGKVKVEDQFCKEVFGPHQSDEELGGTSDILSFAGKEEEGRTVIEFERLLQTGDQFDNPIPPEGEFKIIWAMGKSDDPGEKHSQKGYGVLNPSLPQNPSPSISLFLFHAGFTLLGSIFLGINLSLVLKKKKKKTMVSRHKTFGLIGAVIFVLGLVLGIYEKRFAWGFNLGTAHFFLGCLSLILLSTTLVLGGNALKRKNPKMRSSHLGIARTTVLFLMATLVLGLLLFLKI